MQVRDRLKTINFHITFLKYYIYAIQSHHSTWTSYQVRYPTQPLPQLKKRNHHINKRNRIPPSPPNQQPSPRQPNHRPRNALHAPLNPPHHLPRSIRPIPPLLALDVVNAGPRFRLPPLTHFIPLAKDPGLYAAHGAVLGVVGLQGCFLGSHTCGGLLGV